MEINNHNQSKSSIERSSHVDPPHLNNKRIIFPIIFGLFLLLLAVYGAGYHLGTLSNPSMQTTNTSVNAPTSIQVSMLTPTLQPTAAHSLIVTQTPLDQIPSRIISENGMVVYEHPTAHYTLEYPTSWKGGTEPKQ